MSSSAIETALQVIWWLTIAGHLALYVRLRASGLHRIYHAFSAYLLVRTGRSLLLVLIPWLSQSWGWKSRGPFASDAYFWVWALTEPLLWLFYILVVLELYSLVLQRYKGLSSLSRWVVLGGLGLATVVSTVSLWADFSNPNEQFPIVRWLTVVDRGVLFGVLVFLAIVVCFLRWCPVPLSRNVVVHCIVFAAYFFGLSASLLFRNVLGDSVTRVVSFVCAGITLGALVVWFRMLTAANEHVEVVPWHADPAAEHSLVQNLDAINASLLRVARK